MANPLSPEKLLEIIKSTITSPSSSGSSSPPDDVSTTSTLTNPTSLIALLVHAIHTSLGFRQVRPAPPTLDSDGATSQDPLERNKWPREWWERNSASGEESFSLEYRHEQSSLVFQVRIARLGGRTVVNAVAVEDDKTATLDIVTSDYISSSNFPQDLTGDNGLSNLASLFNSPTRLSDFIKAYKTQVIQKLIPRLVKPGYAEETTARSGGNSGNIGGNAPPPSAGPSQPRPQPLRPDNETDPGRIGAPPNFPRPGFGQNPLEIGRSDLDPLGGAVGRLPGAGGDGMFVGPNHPLFGREQEQQNPLGGGNGQRGPWGGDGYLPPLGAPPGARFDPITPFGLGGNRPNQPNQRNWGDEFPPPGFDNELGRGAQGQGGFNPLNPQGGGLGGLGGPRGGFGGPRGGGGMGGNGGFGNMFM